MTFKLLFLKITFFDYSVFLVHTAQTGIPS